MKKFICLIILTTISSLLAQDVENCFLYDYQPLTAEIPLSVQAEKPADSTTATVTIQDDTLGTVSRYLFGNAIAAWAGAHDDPVFVAGVELLAPTLIRFPGGSWSNGYFWSGLTDDLPDSIPDGTTYNSETGAVKKAQFWGQTGVGGWQTSTEQYYTLRENSKVSEGLITVNYAYARYGLSDDPVAQAAHYAADWVRYDNGRTKFWEIGNENGGPWEYGWVIDTTLNKDGQPAVISGELYGKHFNVFVDSMKAAAQEIGTEVFIGAQLVVYGPSSWNFVDRDWNEGFFREAGDKADFYVVHNYFGANYQAKYLLNVAVTEPKKSLDFIKSDIRANGAAMRPVALTEYNMGLGASLEQSVSYINGMQGTILICEMMKNNYGMAARWLLNSGPGTMFGGNDDNNYLYHPRPEFYYLYYLQKFFGDHALVTTSDKTDVLFYATRFSSGETAVIVVNKGTVDQTVDIETQTIGVGEHYYIYSFSGGTDHGDFSENVIINGHGPGEYHWGPFDDLTNLPADSYPVGDDIRISSPARSVQMVMIEGGETIVSVDNESNTHTVDGYRLLQNHPNPFNPTTHIDYELPDRGFVTLKIHDVLGREVVTLVNGLQNAGNHSVLFDASAQPSGVYFYTLQAGNYKATKKLLLLK